MTNSKKMTATILIVFLLFFQTTVHAAYNTMPEKNFPRLLEANLVSGDSGNVTVELYFSNNVGCIDETQEGRYNMEGYNSANLTKFIMKDDEGGADIPITVKPHPKAAKHEDTSKYFYVYAESLDIQKQYTITIAEDLYANMGNSLGVPYEITFNVAANKISFKALGEVPSNGAVMAPLKFEASNIENNSRNVELQLEINMAFSFNVSGPDVFHYNKSQFTLFDGDTAVPIIVEPGSTVRDFVIRSIMELNYSTEYKLVVTKELMARNGVMLSSPINLFFTTKGLTDTDDEQIELEDVIDYADYFSDIEGNWAADDIVWLADRKFVSGGLDGLFRPNDNITRAQMITILTQALELEDVDVENPFIDTENHWAEKYIIIGVKNDIASGVSENMFAPGGSLTREQMAVMAVRASGIQANEMQPKLFEDSAQISEWAHNYVDIASANEIIGGYADGSFKPSNNITRAEACHIICNILKTLNKYD